jgi:hypothetical protein
MAGNLDPDVAQLSREVVESVAPSELPLFNAVSREYAKNPERALKAIAGRDEVLGFGVAAGVLLTPVVISVAEAVIKFVAAELLKLGQQAAGTAVDTTVRGVLARAAATKSSSKPESKTAVALSAAQLGEIRKVAINRALSIQLPRDQAERLADAMVARLATAAG